MVPLQVASQGLEVGAAQHLEASATAALKGTHRVDRTGERRPDGVRQSSHEACFVRQGVRRDRLDASGKLELKRGRVGGYEARRRNHFSIAVDGEEKAEAVFHHGGNVRYVLVGPARRTHGYKGKAAEESDVGCSRLQELRNHHVGITRVEGNRRPVDDLLAVQRGFKVVLKVGTAVLGVRGKAMCLWARCGRGMLRHRTHRQRSTGKEALPVGKGKGREGACVCGHVEHQGKVHGRHGEVRKSHNVAACVFHVDHLDELRRRRHTAVTGHGRPFDPHCCDTLQHRDLRYRVGQACGRVSPDVYNCALRSELQTLVSVQRPVEAHQRELFPEPAYFRARFTGCHRERGGQGEHKTREHFSHYSFFSLLHTSTLSAS
eukprot:Rhum_TRINITY_DN3097_c0_g1::Rhum_TRINITY_DN3097_c0_g1_i1::g.9557::m.9557